MGQLADAFLNAAQASIPEFPATSEEQLLTGPELLQIVGKAYAALSFLENMLRGAKILKGKVAPEANQGEDGDAYFNTVTTDFYIKELGSWGAPTPLKGKDGKGSGTNLPDDVVAALTAADAPSASNAYATVKQLPKGKVSVTRIADGSRQYYPIYTDMQNSLLAGDIVDLYYPITAVVPPVNSRTVLPIPTNVRANLNGQSIGQNVPHDNKVGMLITSGTGYINGNGAVIYGFGPDGKAIETGDINNNNFDYALNDVNIRVDDGAIGVHSRRGGILRHSGNITILGTSCIGVKVLTSGRYEGQGQLKASGGSQALLATQAGSIRYSGRIDLPATSTIQAQDAGSRISLEQIVVDGQTDRTVGNPLLVNGQVGTTIVLTDATILGEAGQTVIQADTLIYRGRCTVIGNVVATTIIGAPSAGDDAVTQKFDEEGNLKLEFLPEQEIASDAVVRANGEILENNLTNLFALMSQYLAENGYQPGGGGTSNTPPVAFAGNDATITLPTASVTRTGTATDADGTIASVLWTKQSGPATFTITSPATVATSFSNLVEGVYVFRLTVTDDKGATHFDDVQVTVNAAPVGGGGGFNTTPMTFNTADQRFVTLDANNLNPVFNNANDGANGGIPAIQTLAAGVSGGVIFDLPSRGCGVVVAGAAPRGIDPNGGPNTSSLWFNNGGYVVSRIPAGYYGTFGSGMGKPAYDGSATMQGRIHCDRDTNLFHTFYTLDAGATWVEITDAAGVPATTAAPAGEIGFNVWFDYYPTQVPGLRIYTI